MESEEISELDQVLLTYAIDLLNNKYNTVDDLVKMWLLYGPYMDRRIPRPEIRKPWMAGLGVTKRPS